VVKAERAANIALASSWNEMYAVPKGVPVSLSNNASAETFIKGPPTGVILNEMM
jgi:hypothetical protein